MTVLLRRFAVVAMGLAALLAQPLAAQPTGNGPPANGPPRFPMTIEPDARVQQKTYTFAPTGEGGGGCGQVACAAGRGSGCS